ncbi:hypothetical protein [Mariniflexile sp. AS56]|uniref:hypothetical protein n=1 Tax=Mariniflexile sp. AS56 TaxID=3063957 RepID=UPI0026EAE205|nr:hypothetical protein [Mariniflexile sp. AS56]MDO7174143.1 hypothetical protein [Mariniflexile sp. AS56]
MDNGTLTQWNRLESRPRKVDFTRAMRAEIRDALWMMTRQWQLGELTAQDVGIPITAKIFYQNTILDKLRLGENKIVAVKNDLPLETLVERENIHVTKRSGKDHINDVALSNSFRKRLINLIKDEDGFTKAIKDNIVNELNEHPSLQYYLPTTDIDSANFEDISIKVNSELHKMHAAFASRAFHGGKLYISLKSGDKLSSYITNLASTNKNKLDAIGEIGVVWFNNLFNQSNYDKNTAWHPNQLEYQFSTVSPDAAGNPILLKAKEYYGGRLDWYASDVSLVNNNSNSRFTSNLRAELLTKSNDEVFPAEIEFPGVPHSRWWEIENGKLNFSQIQPNKTDLAKILFAEFGLLFSNNWFVMPLTLPFGSLTKIERIEIKDTFGQYTLVKHYQNYSENKNWGMFSLANSETGNTVHSDYLYIPPVAYDLLISDPLEKINFIRDEMANMVWGIESVIPDGMGMGIEGKAMATQIREYYNRLTSEKVNNESNVAKIEYQLVTEVPENWIPFIPVKVQNDNPLSRQIQLQRAQLPRIVGENNPMRIEPRTSLLLREQSPYYIFEEEIPKSGVIIELHWQRTRMANGKNVIWLGRKKTNGRGEGSSALAYDQIKSE